MVLLLHSLRYDYDKNSNYFLFQHYFHYTIIKEIKNVLLLPIKTGKKLRTTYYLGCKDYTHNFRPKVVKMTNKVLRKKSNCIVCRSNKSRFLKQKSMTKNNLAFY